MGKRWKEGGLEGERDRGRENARDGERKGGGVVGEGGGAERF